MVPASGISSLRVAVLFLGLVLSAVFLSEAAVADHGSCTTWQRKSGFTCIFNGRSAKIWVRQCFHIWDKTEVCMDQDPNTLGGPCSPWETVSATSCFSGVRFEQKWVRACSDELLKTEFCSDSVDPNTMGL